MTVLNGVCLAGIAEFIAGDNRRRAASFVREVVESCERLAAMPERLQLVARRENAGIRRRRFRIYLILHTVRCDTMEIVRVLNGAQDH